MSSSHLEADFIFLVSTIRTRLHGHRSHRFKVFVYKWWDAAVVVVEVLERKRFSLGREAASIANSNRHRLSAIARGLVRELPKDGVVAFDERVEFIVARVGR